MKVLTKPYLDKLKARVASARHLIVKYIVVASSPPQEEIDLVEAMELSAQLVDGYVTLDWEHRMEIYHLMTQIRGYVQDESRTRPLNVIMHADPGSGKSHFVKCLAKSSYLNVEVGVVTFNMVGMRNVEDLIQPLDQVRNLKVVDKTPILFLDEFDSEQSNYATLLPLLWDGEIHAGHRELKTGKIVILLALRLPRKK